MPQRHHLNDGPRVAPSRSPGPGADDLFNARARPAPVTADGAAVSDRDRERLLAGWLLRQMRVACPGCGRPIEWAGRWEDMPQCAACHRIPELEALVRFDAEFAELVRVVPAERCSTCGKDMGFVTREANGVEGPVDLRANVYVTFLPARVTAGGDGLVFYAATAKDLADARAKLVFPDGREVPMADVRFAASHYATCPSAKFHSRKGGYRA